MGVSLKNIFNDNEDELVVNKSKKAIRSLIFMAGAVFLVLIIVAIINNIPDGGKERREKIIHDIKVVQTAVRSLSIEYRKDPDSVQLLGTSLENTPQVINANGIEEEYRYGYYLLTPEDLAMLTSALNLVSEYYIVNYDTYDVINWDGIEYKKMKYHSIEDILIVAAGEKPVAKQIIRTASDLEKIRSNPNGYFKLSGNLDLSDYELGEGWEPIKQFSGTLDGRGYTISNLTIHRPATSKVGLFGELSATSTVTNLKFESVNITGGEYVGTLAGSTDGTISHIEVVSGDVSGQSRYVGGLVGSQNKGTISNCMVTLNSVQGIESVGGIVGIMPAGTLTKSGAKTNVTGRNSVGGAIGLASVSEATYIHEIMADTQLIGSNNIGGLIGNLEILRSYKLEFKNSYSKGSIKGATTNSGGLIGVVTSVSDANLVFEDLYTTLDILNKSVTSGGCIGYTDIAITSSVIISDCFWEKDLAPGETLNSVGSEASNTFTLSFTNKNYLEMRIPVTFEGWDFSIWGIKERVDTPYLKWEI